MVGVVQADAVGDLGVDFEGFFSDTAAFVGTHGAERAHIVQAVGEFDDDHAHVFGHGEDELAKTFRLMLGMIFKFEFFEFGKPVHHLGDGFAEFCRHFDFRYACIFEYVVHHARAQALNVHVPQRKLGGDGKGVGNVGFAAFTGLPVMGVKGVGDGFFKLGLFGWAEIGGGAEQKFAGFGSQRVIGGSGLGGGHFRRPSVCVLF